MDELSELYELFDEIVTFEDEIKNKDPSTCIYPDKIKAKRVFHEYLDWRFNQIKSGLAKHTNHASWGL